MIKTIVDDSQIHGTGLFALENVRPGELIGFMEGEIVVEEKDNMHVLWLEDEEGRWFGIKGTGCMRYLNHSEEPNAILATNSPYIYCARPIEPHEEITISYGDDMDFDEKEE